MSETPAETPTDNERHEEGVKAAALAMLADDFERNQASSDDWDDLAREAQATYLAKARKVVNAYRSVIPGNIRAVVPHTT
ncbi:hypothetical protein [Actinophytocola sp.]|uniref:hypothetical protein n=1 Tax=Actinophytocola sp. TaxID=1872138 RepID=UPI002D62E9F6|nr:hypothetical protein [Actinophytocola sp.]HYQ69769.1 hypothetical protein [Actinophytocola sp.]